MYARRSSFGFSLIEVVIVAALSTLVFGALFVSFHFALKLVSQSRAKLSALSLANERLEYFRSLPYDDVGTVSGIPSGLIPQQSTTTLNGRLFYERVLVEYVDDDADGLNTLDANSIVADYKRIKIEYSWNVNNATSSISLISNIVPRSIETTAGGGTVRVNVIDADSNLLPGASVQLVNNSIVPAIDVTRYTDSSGSALFSGAPAGSGYELYVTAVIGGKTYSETQTYEVTVANPNPILAPFAVLEADISTVTLQIGELSDLDIGVRSAVATGSTTESFATLLGVASSSNVTVSGGEGVLESVAGVYDTTGFLYIPITPTTIVSWGALKVAADVPTGTSYTVQFFTGSGAGPYTRIPDADLPGNSTGFSGLLTDISTLDPVAYPAVMMGITLETTDTSVSPQLDEVAVFYKESQTNISGLAVSLHGEKIIGTQTDTSNIYKYEDTVTTNASGNVALTDVEFDTYTFSFPVAYAIAQACPAHPFVQQAGIDGEAEFVLVADPSYSMRVSVVNAAGQAIPGVSIEMKRPSFSTVLSSSLCGQVFFSTGLAAHDDYEVVVSAAGYATETRTGIVVDADEELTVTLTES